MVELPSVTLIAIDTVNHALALRALACSRADVRFARTMFVTDKVPADIHVPDGIEIATIRPLWSREAYSEFVLKGLSAYMTTTHALLISEGRTVAAGPARQTVTTDNVTAAFAHPVEVRYDEGRWVARTKATRIDV